MRLIDSHCHIHDPEFFGDERQGVYEAAVQRGIGMLVVGTDDASSEAAVKFAEGRELAWSVVGVHPHEAKFGCERVKGLLAEGHESIVGIGEIGLDYFYHHSPKEVQQTLLEEQLQLAVDYNLPVSFHVRDAFDDFWPIFRNFSGLRGVLHSFTDSRANAERGLSEGLYIGINGISTFTKDETQQELYRTLPLKNILLETDAPFLTPKPLRGKVNRVEYVELVAEWCATQRGVTLEDVAAITCQNTRQLFNI